MTTGLPLSSTVYTPGGVHSEILRPPTSSVPPIPMLVGIVRTSAPLLKTLICLVASSAMETCASPIRNETRLSSCPNSPSPKAIP